MTPPNWKPWKVEALLRLERGKPLFVTPFRTKRHAEFRKRFLQELYDEWLIEPGKNGPTLTDAGRGLCERFRHPGRPLKYDARQMHVIVTTPSAPGCNVMLAERFGTTAAAIQSFRKRHRAQIAREQMSGQANRPSGS